MVKFKTLKILDFGANRREYIRVSYGNSSLFSKFFGLYSCLVHAPSSLRTAN